MTRSCVYCGCEEATLWNITHKIKSKIILLDMISYPYYLCPSCYLENRHLPDMKKRWKNIIFYEISEQELQALPKHILTHVKKERDIELEHKKKGLDYEVTPLV